MGQNIPGISDVLTTPQTQRLTGLNENNIVKRQGDQILID